ncbi:MAG TPA: hypothetical protein VJ506_03115 [Candidatus Limnocylindrales bacterium]|nr:hypothetical protein [Candidatus Limnocylindrales bacterium]
MALTEARRAASEARELMPLAESTWPQAVEHLQLSAAALDRVAIAIAADADVNPWYQTAWAEEDAARTAILSGGPCSSPRASSGG